MNVHILSSPTVFVVGEPGVYNLYPMSSTGKTYLFNILLQAKAERAVLVTYRDGMNVVHVGSNPVLVLCDRADMYDSDPAFRELLDTYKDSCCVCIDSKKGTYGPDFWAELWVDKEKGIEVNCAGC